jgi:hypothetical protein
MFLEVPLSITDFLALLRQETYVTAAGSAPSLLDSDGTLDLRHNWFKPAWVRSLEDLSKSGQLPDSA